MSLPPFPPYSTLGLSQRFPNDPSTQARIARLQAWLLDGEVPDAFKDVPISQRTLYRLRTAWELEGLAGLFAPQRRPAVAITAEFMRKLLNQLRQETPFVLGLQDEAQTLLPQQPDPAVRGHLLGNVLRLLIAETDATLLAEHGLHHLLERRFLLGDSIDLLATDLAWSRSSLYRLLNDALSDMAQRLPALLETAEPTPAWAAFRCPDLIGREAELHALSETLATSKQAQLVGLVGMGKSALAAQLADSWARAGWNVFWVRYPVAAIAPIDTLVAALYDQMAGVGLVRSTRPDSTRAYTEHLDLLSTALNRLPTLLVIDDVHLGAGRSTWAKTLGQLTRRCDSLRVLLVGHYMPQPVGPELTLDGLSHSEAQALYAQVQPAFDSAQWPFVYAMTNGNPMLLRLATPAMLSAPQADQGVRTILRANVAGLSAEARRLLLWLGWWDGPISRQHEFVQAAQAVPNAWQSLIQRSLINLSHDYVRVHTLVGPHLVSLFSDNEWASVRQAVERYAEQAQQWELAFRCAIDANDLTAQLRWSRAAGLADYMAGDPVRAQRWARRFTKAAVQAQNAHAEIDGRLAEIACLIRLHRVVEAHQILATLPPLSDPAQQWWAALYRLQLCWFSENYDTAEALLHQPPLSEPPPPGTGRVSGWRMQLEQIYYWWVKGKVMTAWKLFRTIQQPPTSHSPLQMRFYALGAQLALERGDYAQYEQINKIQRRLTRQQEARSGHHTYTLSSAQLAWASIMYERERYPLAAQRLSQVEATLQEDWISLRAKAALYQGLVAFELGDMSTTYHHAESQHQYADTHISFVRTCTLMLHGVVGLGNGDYAEAMSQFQQLLERPCPLTERSMWALAHLCIVRIALGWGEIDQAQRYLASATDLTRNFHLYRVFPYLRLAWGDYYRTTGAYDRAIHQYDRAITTFRASELHVSLARALGRYGEMLLDVGAPSQAAVATEEAVQVIQRLPLGLRVAPRVWLSYAGAMQAIGQPDTAAQAWAQAINHLRWQAQHLPPNTDPARFFQQPFLRTIVQHVGGINALLHPNTVQATTALPWLALLEPHSTG